MSARRRRGVHAASRLLALGALMAALALSGCGTLTRATTPARAQPAVVSEAGDAGRGQQAIRRYGCDACHTIPGVPGATGAVGPSLANVGARAFLAGTIRNTPDSLARWIERPQALKPGTAMPDLGVTPADARDIVAYLQRLR